MAYFQAGDRVTVRHDIMEDEGSPPYRYAMDNGLAYWDVTGWMVTQAGEPHIISSAHEDGYRLRDAACVWTDEMFEEYINRNDDAGEFEAAEPADILSLIGVR